MKFEPRLPQQEPKSEDLRPEYKLGFNEQNESTDLPKPYEMTFQQFQEEFQRVMTAVKEKEKKGRLDPSSQPYEPLSPDEWAFMAKDWKAFSRSRGYDEEDIKEYERWLELSGQRADLPGAINDPWRRERFEHDKRMYVGHIEKAIAEGKEISEDIRKNFEEVKESINVNPLKRFMGSRESQNIIEVPSEIQNNIGEGDDIW